MSERNKAHMRRVVEEIYNQGNLAAVDELAASGLVIHAASQEIHGREGARQYVSALRAGLQGSTSLVLPQALETYEVRFA